MTMNERSSNAPLGTSFHGKNTPFQDLDDSDEERELTNLNWLLRNQNLTWPNTIELNTEDHFIASSESQNSIIRQTQTKQVLITKCINKTEKIVDFKTTQKAITKRLSPSERYEIFVSKVKRDLTEYEKFATKYETDVTEKPPFNYSNIIGMAILKNGRVTLQEICSWIESKFAFFRVRKKWNNSIRHNLSLHHCFRNRKREEKKGKGGYWELGVDPKKCERKRIRNRKLCHQKNKQTVKDPNVTNQKYLDPNHLRSKLSAISQMEVNFDNDYSLISAESRSQIPHIAPYEEQYSLYTNKVSSGEGQKSLYSFISDKIDTTNMISRDDGFYSTFSDITIYSHIEPSSTIGGDNIQEEKNNISSDFISTPSHPYNITINYDYSNFRPLTDSLDEQFHNLENSGVYSRNDDILDNLLNVKSIPLVIVNSSSKA